MLSASRGIGYLHEPFHVGHRLGVCGARFDQWFTYITKENEGRYLEPIRRTLEFRYDASAELATLRSLKDVARMARDWSRFARLRWRGARPLMKDPIALFSAEWLAEKFDMDVVVLIRHPAAFVSSLKNLGWGQPFADFAAQPELMRDLLAPFRGEIEQALAGAGDSIDRSAMLWKIIHHVILQYRERHAGWLLRRHEDLSRKPLAEFEVLYSTLGLRFDDRVRRVIVKYSGDQNPRDPSDARSMKRDSTGNTQNWAYRLTSEEIDRIRTRVEDVSSRFYSDDDWEPRIRSHERA